MEFLKWFRREPTQPEATGLVFAPSPRCARRRLLGRGLVGVGAAAMLTGLVRQGFLEGVEQPQMKRQANLAFPPPTKNEYRDAKEQIATANGVAHSELQQAFDQGRAITLTPPPYLADARAVIEAEHLYQDKLSQLFKAGGYFDRQNQNMGALFSGVFTAMAGFLFHSTASTQIRREEDEFRWANQRSTPRDSSD